MNMVRLQMPFQNPALLLSCQAVKHFPHFSSDLAI
jgi:hypothetical protein